jgi:hypothetical protein
MPAIGLADDDTGMSFTLLLFSFLLFFVLSFPLPSSAFSSPLAPLTVSPVSRNCLALLPRGDPSERHCKAEGDGDGRRAVEARDGEQTRREEETKRRAKPALLTSFPLPVRLPTLAISCLFAITTFPVDRPSRASVRAYGRDTIPRH